MSLYGILRLLKRGMVVAIAGLAIVGVVAAQERASEEEDEDEIELIFDVAKYGDEWRTGDMNDDGLVDYAVLLDEDLMKQREVMDFNKDGLMDDFYFYENEVLVREELDTNYDGAVDLWIYMHEGVYVKMWKRDTNYDGEVDTTKDYGEQD
jgi:hypothetical protein